MMENLINAMQCLSINNEVIEYISHLEISYDVKELLMHLIENDNYQDYAQIYEICVENNIELPPL